MGRSISTYQASAARSRAKRGPRLLQAVVGRPGTRLQLAHAAKQEATDRSSVRGLPGHSSRVERAGSISVDCTADKTSGERNLCWWRGLSAKRDSIGRRCSQAHWSRRAQPDGCPRGQPDRTERRQAIWPPRYNHLHLGGPVRARQAGTGSIQGEMPPRPPTRDSFNRSGRPRRRRFKPALALTPQP